MNYHRNHWVVKAGSKEALKAIREVLEDEDGVFTFEKLVPMPEAFEYKRIPGTMKPLPPTSLDLWKRWLVPGRPKDAREWMIQRWGVTHGPCDARTIVDRSALRVDYVFDTPWGPPGQIASCTGFAGAVSDWIDDLYIEHQEVDDWYIEIIDWSYHLG